MGPLPSVPAPPLSLVYIMTLPRHWQGGGPGGCGVVGGGGGGWGRLADCPFHGIPGRLSTREVTAQTTLLIVVVSVCVPRGFSFLKPPVSLPIISFKSPLRAC